MHFRDRIIAARAIGSENYDDAIAVYKKSLETDIDESETLIMLALCYEWKGEIESALQYANKRLAQNPNDYEMLLLAARCWSERENEDQTYNYVCRAIENVPYSEPPEPPRVVFSIFKLLSLFKRFRALDSKAKKDNAAYNEYHKENIEWAFNYKEWYEAKNGTIGSNRKEN
jgi:tetratricopeptide (TPR) repeat protein